MTLTEAREIARQQEKQLDHFKRANTQTVTQEYLYIEAKGFIEGYESAQDLLAEKDAEINVLKAQFDNDAKRDKTILEENLYLLKDRDKKESVIKALVEALKFYDHEGWNGPAHQTLLALAEGRKK